MSSRRILIVKLSAIGDVVQTLPAVEAIKKHEPEAEITWVVEEAAAGILEGHPAISRVLVSRRKSWLRMLAQPATAGRGLGAARAFFRELRSTRYDVAIDFQGLFKSGVVIGLARADRKIGFRGQRECASVFLNERLPAFDIEQHALERYLLLARHLGAADALSSCTLPIEHERETVAARLRAVLPPGRQLVLINPMARWKTKLWHEDSFAELADRLIRERNAFVIFTGSAADRPVVEVVRGMMREQALNWAGETTLKELAALAEQGALFVTTDTGPMHLAAAAGARVLALFGPTAPWRTGPYGDRHVVVRTGIACSPCFRKECDRGLRCMKEITVEDVMRKVPL